MKQKKVYREYHEFLRIVSIKVFQKFSELLKYFESHWITVTWKYPIPVYNNLAFIHTTYKVEEQFWLLSF